MTARVCERCGARFTRARRPSARDPQRFCSRTCRTEFTRRKPRACVGCGRTFRPGHSTQRACSRPCASAASAPTRRIDTMLVARRARAQAYAARLAERLAGLSKSAIWRLAYTRGWQAAWLKYGKGHQVPKRPACEVAAAALEARP